MPNRAGIQQVFVADVLSYLCIVLLCLRYAKVRCHLQKSLYPSPCSGALTERLCAGGPGMREPPLNPRGPAGQRLSLPQLSQPLSFWRLADRSDGAQSLGQVEGASRESPQPPWVCVLCHFSASPQKCTSLLQNKNAIIYTGFLVLIFTTTLQVKPEISF